MAAIIHIPAIRVRRPSFALIAVVADVALLLPLAYLLNIWQDEAYTLHTTAFGVRYAFMQAMTFEQNAPLYFILITLWRHFAGSIFGLRLFSIACAAVTILLVPHIARRYLPRIDPGLVTAAAAWNPFLIWAALEIRVYAMVVLLSALLLLTFYEAFLARDPKRHAAALYALCVAAALYTQYYLAFLVAAQLAVVLIYRHASLRAFLLAAGAGGLAFVPLLAAIPGQVQDFRSPFTPPTLLRSFSVIAGIMAHYVLPLPFAHPRTTYAVIAAIAAITVLVTHRSFAKTGDPLLPLLTLVAATVFALVTFAAGVEVLNRHAASLYLPGVLSVFALFTFLRPELRATAVTAWFCISIAASAAVVTQTYWHLAKPGDWSRVVQRLHERERPGEPVAIFEAENALPFAYYYHGPNRIVPIPSAVDFRRYDVSRFIVRDERQLRRTMPRSRRIWLITAGECASANVQFGCDVLERYVRTHYRTWYDATFYQARMRLLSPL